MTDTYMPRPPTKVTQNPIRNGEDWRAMRQACEQDGGAFHGGIAARSIHWFHQDLSAWLSLGENGIWRGWNTITGERVDLLNWSPWQEALDESAAPFYRWFTGAQTNAAFNEVDRHVLSGHGEETAFFYEGDRWDPSASAGNGVPFTAVLFLAGNCW